MAREKTLLNQKRTSPKTVQAQTQVFTIVRAWLQALYQCSTWSSFSHYDIRLCKCFYSFVVISSIKTLILLVTHTFYIIWQMCQNRSLQFIIEFFRQNWLYQATEFIFLVHFCERQQKFQLLKSKFKADQPRIVPLFIFSRPVKKNVITRSIALIFADNPRCHLYDLFISLTS